MGKIKYQGRLVDPDTVWKDWFTTSAFTIDKRLRRIYQLLPRDPRCQFCNVPFEGAGALMARTLLGKKRSALNPRFCNLCDEAARRFPSGSEVEMAMLFADVRGSTALSQQMSPRDFSQLINRFYTACTKVIVEHDGLVEKLAGDAVAAFWGAGFAGEAYVRRTVGAARELSETMARQAIPVGIGVHAGVAYFGSVGTPDGLTNISAIGDEVNLAARIASEAAAGEVLVSEQALAAADLNGSAWQTRQLTLKGIAGPVTVRVLAA